MPQNATISESSMRKVTITALAGTSIEWYDFFIYGTAAALVFSGLFFPGDMPAGVGLIAAFSTFAVGFFALVMAASGRHPHIMIITRIRHHRAADIT